MEEPSDTVSAAGGPAGAPGASQQPREEPVAAAPPGGPAGGNGGSGGDRPPGGTTPEGGAERRRPSGVDEVIFHRDLHEVFLLIDFISGRPDKNLQDLKVSDPDATSAGTDRLAVRELIPSEVVSQISKLGYPPDPDPTERARGAALLLLTKDKLTELAAPARGLTIGYTAMFVGSMKDLRLAKRRDDAEIKTGERSTMGVAAATPSQAANPASRGRSNARMTLAFVAFGTFIRHVIVFKRVFRGLITFAFVWLFLTILTYWDVATGRAVLQRIDQFTAAQNTLLGQSGFKPGDCAAGGAQVNSPDCRKWNDAITGINQAHHDLKYLVLCDGSLCWLPVHVLQWGFVLCGVEKELRAEAEQSKDPNGPYLLDQSVGSVITVFSTYILSMMFGLLGTLIAVIRAIQNKVRDSVLGPRDLVLSLIGLPMGLVAGVAVGLFFSPSTAQISGGAIGEVSLSASGLGFLAGYGAEKFFTFLDGLLMRVFPANAGANGRPAPAA